mgnify:CR=1 FL=1
MRHQTGQPAPGSRTSEEKDRRDLARGAGVNYLGFIARIAPRAAFIALAGRFYGEGGFGAYTFGTAVVETAAGIAVFGLKRSLFRFMGEAKAEGESMHRPIANGIAVAVVAALVMTLAVAFAAGGLALAFGLPSATRPLLLLTVAIPFIVLSDVLLAATRFTRQMRFEVYARSLVEPTVLTVALVLLYAAGVGQIGLAFAYVLALLAAALAALLFFGRVYSFRACLKAPLRWPDIRGLVSFSAPTAGYDLLMMFADRADVLLVSYFGTAGTVGIYGMAREFATFTKKIKAGFDRILPPVFSETVAAGDMERAGHQLALVARWILTVQLLIVLLFAFFGSSILGTVAGESFAAGGLVLVLLLISHTVNGCLGVSELPFLYLRPSANMVFGGAMLALTVGIGFFLVQSFGSVGAALTVLITMVLVNSARALASRRMFGLSVMDAAFAKSILAGLGAAVVGWRAGVVLSGLGSVGAMVQATLLLGTYLGILLLLGLEEEDRARLKQVAGRMRGS